MNWKIHLYRAILWLITLSLLLMMFGFSAQEGTQSGSISGKIARPITDSLAQRQIDGAVAMIMALDRAIRCGLGNSGMSVYDEREMLVL